ncbi:hypothetical protein AX774_g1873 [Zancudomyces culisetae]|uniref:Uncharacterized protein n=1 Tax=Zancudomyces culisetae TaxID=1213189 RepID=A0A1R1PUF4_ZANCU|nr:hypothetical protein AX774_g6514 [Zancudomyces culisetae]OMH84591.1 hypothetical protein AX774_g1873 [Zancudomyces culisetae]|eukprot:OMH80072.1 hypothetical protein AX774_g6514 [Zancudomyces culisetae]
MSFCCVGARDRYLPASTRISSVPLSIRLRPTSAGNISSRVSSSTYSTNKLWYFLNPCSSSRILLRVSFNTLDVSVTCVIFFLFPFINSFVYIDAIRFVASKSFFSTSSLYVISWILSEIFSVDNAAEDFRNSVLLISALCRL